VDGSRYLSGVPEDLDGAEVEMAVERWDGGRVDAFRELIARSGIVCEDVVWANRRHLYCSDQFRVFVIEIDGKPRAWATLYADEKWRSAYLGDAYTDPEYRGRGCHRALLEARIADARSLGLKNVFTDVVADTISARNCDRVGLKPIASLTLWRRP
jgi:GNAT superfamily N-acetyltransferase